MVLEGWRLPECRSHSGGFPVWQGSVVFGRRGNTASAKHKRVLLPLCLHKMLFDLVNLYLMQKAAIKQPAAALEQLQRVAPGAGNSCETAGELA